jgi:hypothetical protein
MLVSLSCHAIVGFVALAPHNFYKLNALRCEVHELALLSGEE